MATIRNEIVTPGVVMDVATINNTNNRIATVTADLDDENTNNEWCSRLHFVEGTSPTIHVCNSQFTQKQSTLTQVVNLNTYQLIDLGGVVDFEINDAALALDVGDVLRLHLDIGVEAVVPITPFPLAAVQLGNFDAYGFQFYYSIDNGASYVAFDCESKYSTTVLPTTAILAAFRPTMIALRDDLQRHRQRCNHSLCFINTSAPLAITNVRASVKLQTTGPNQFITSITINNGTFNCIIARN